MNPGFFTDWRNQNESATTPSPPKNYIPSPIPVTEPREKPVACWIDYPTEGGCVLREEKAGGRSWAFPPRVNATRWLETNNRSYWDHDRTLPDYPIVKRLSRLNDDSCVLDWENKPVVRYQRKWSDCALICSLLDLTPYQRLRVHYLLGKLVLNKVGHNVETVAFILAALVCREDGRQFTRHPHSKSEDAIFDKVAREFGIPDKRIRGLLKSLPRRSEISYLFNNRPKRDVPKPVVANPDLPINTPVYSKG